MRHTGLQRALAFFAIGVFGVMLSGCGSRSKVPKPGSNEYREVVSTFYVGLAALQVGDDVHAESKLSQMTRLAPGEPAGWVDWGVLGLRQRNFDAAALRFYEARKLAGKNDQIWYLLGILESARGHSTEAIADLRKTVEINPKNLRAAYQLAQEIERQGGENSDAEFQHMMQSILTVQPDNLAALLELARMAAKRGDKATLNSAAGQISARSSAWPAEVKQQLAALQSAAAGADPKAAATRTILLRNALMRVPEFRHNLAAIKAPPGEEAEPVTHFLRMESPPLTAAAADTSLTFNPEPVADGTTAWDLILAVSLDAAAKPSLILINGRTVHLPAGADLPFPGGSSRVPPLQESVLAIDFDYDFRPDLVLAGAGGVRLFRQESPSQFTDVTASAKLPRDVVSAKYTGAWSADIEADGDLDIVLGSEGGSPTVLRNNGDGTFTVIHPFNRVSGLAAFVWADLDGDGNPDAALVDGAGRLHVFHNERAGEFREQSLPADLPLIKALNVADVNGDGILDLLVLQANGVVKSLSEEDGQRWDSAVLATVPNAEKTLGREARLHVADLDNNGALDLIVSPISAGTGQGAGGALVWLGSGRGQFSYLGQVGPQRVFGVQDVNGDGRLDLVGLAGGHPTVAINHGSRNYHWQVVRPRARQATGDQRINPFGIGGEIEIRSGLLVQTLAITEPQAHFGLGEHTGADVVRVLWPNGTASAEFEVQADQQIVTEQRIKGSCPYLFAFNGHQVEFVKDAVPWGSAIGLRINTLGTARVEATEEWYKIGGDQLSPHDGFYDLRFTAELWETYYYDSLALIVADHPAGSEILVDERFVIPPAKLAITTVETPHKIVRAVDDTGRDVTDIVSALDGRYLDTFGRGQYQGVTRDHYVELDLGDDAPATGPLWLIAKGWMHPTDSSINVAISQGHHEQAHGLNLEVINRRGEWITAKANLGFPAGRNKICLFDLANVFRPGAPHRLRLRTNLEIYWDSFEWARGMPGAPLQTVRLSLQTADLRYRGYSVMRQANASSPELPDYNRLEGTKQRWRDLSGYYTRFGDVRELLEKVDDRYVIMNSGDEMTLRFPEQPPPAAGWVRDYIIVGDGWIKDGDYNSTFSKTVQPLPYHARQQYTTPPGKLEDEWTYRHHPEDWEKFQTRYVSDEVFRNALRSAPAQ